MIKSGISLFLVLLSHVVWSQEVYHKTIGGIKLIGKPHMAAFYDGGLAIVAQTDSLATVGQESLAIIRFDSCEQESFSNVYALPEMDNLISDVSTTRNNEVLVMGYSNNLNQGLYLLKIDSEGQVVFYKNFTWSNNIYTYSIREAEDGAYFIYGNLYKQPGTEVRNFILKVSSDGTFLWCKTYFSIAIWGRAEATSDGGLITRTGRIIYKVDKSGNLEWASSVSGLSYYESIPLEVSDGYVFARYSNSSTKENHSYVFKLDKNGNLLWTSQSFKSEDIQNISELPNGDLVLMGDRIVDSISTTKKHIAMIKLDKNGKMLLQKIKSTPANETQKQNDLIAINERKIFLCGSETGLLSDRVFVSKTNANFHMGECGDFVYSEEFPTDVISVTKESTNSENLLFTYSDQNITSYTFNSKLSYKCGELLSPKLELGEDTVVCSNFEMKLSSDSFEFDHYLWSTGEKTESIVVSQAGKYYLEAYYGCDVYSDTIVIEKLPEIIPEYQVKPKKTNPFVPIIFKSLTDSVQEICWDIETIGINCQPYFSSRFLENGTYRVVYSFKDSLGCFYSDTTSFEIQLNTFHLPNSFTPNRDDKNEVFEPVGQGISSYELRIFNSWGDLIFEGYNEGWDGTRNGQEIGSDTYVYRIIINQDNGEKLEKLGSVNLFK